MSANPPFYRARRAKLSRKAVLQVFDDGRWHDVEFDDVPYTFEIIDVEQANALRERVARADYRAAAQRRAYAERKRGGIGGTGKTESQPEEKAA